MPLRMQVKQFWSHSLAVGQRTRCNLWDCLSHNVQCHSLPVGHRKRCNETAFHKMCNVTHKLLVIGKDVMRLPFTNYKLCNATYLLLVIGKDTMSLAQIVQCHSLAVGQRKRCNETAFHIMCNVTHKLLVIGKDAMRLSFIKCAMSLTCCWS